MSGPLRANNDVQGPGDLQRNEKRLDRAFSFSLDKEPVAVFIWSRAFLLESRYKLQSTGATKWRLETLPKVDIIDYGHALAQWETRLWDAFRHWRMRICMRGRIISYEDFENDASDLVVLFEKIRRDIAADHDSNSYIVELPEVGTQ